MNPVDRIKLETELQNKRVYSPDEAKRNIAEALTGAAYSTPLAIPLGLRDAMEGKWKAQKQRAAGDEEGARKTEAGAIASTGGAFFPGTRGIAGDIEGAASRVGVFAGPMAKTANQDKLALAKAMVNNGSSKDSIWEHTGWFQGIDNKWRFEIPDNESLLRPSKLGPHPSSAMPTSRVGAMGDFLSHDELYGAYPELASATAMYHPEMTALYGRYSGGGPATAETISVSGKAPSPLGTTLHESQHGIQAREDFARGTNLDTPPGFYELKAQWLKDNPGKELGIRDISNLKQQAYRYSAGEVEARNVEARRLLTPSQRQIIPPWKTEDTPPELQLVHYNSGPSSSFIPAADEAKTEMARLMMQNLPKNYSRPDKANRAIFDQTGLVFGPEGAAKQWIPDSGMKIVGGKPVAGQETQLGNFVDHPALFDAMPELAKTPINFMPAAPVGNQGRYYTPIARTNASGGYEVSEHMKPGQMRQELAKLMSYSIAEKSGFAAAGRHAVGENISKIDDTIAAVNKGVESGDIPGETGVPYMERLQKIKGKIDAAQTAARTDAGKSPWLSDLGKSGPLEAGEARKAISIALNNRMAGNIDARLAKQRVLTGEADYPYSGSSLTESIVLPQRTDDMRELARFLANWKNYGQAAKPPR